MAKMNIPAGKTIYTSRYGEFKGVDCSKSAEICDVSRFPDADNLMFDSAGFPEKRYGYRCLFSGLGNIHSMKQVTIDDKKMMLIHAGDGLYKYDGEKLTRVRKGMKRFSIEFTTKTYTDAEIEEGTVKARFTELYFYRHYGWENADVPLKFGRVILLDLSGDYPKLDSNKLTKVQLDKMTFDEIDKKYEVIKTQNIEAWYAMAKGDPFGAYRYYGNLIKEDVYSGTDSTVGWKIENNPQYKMYGDYVRLWLDENDGEDVSRGFVHSDYTEARKEGRKYYLTFEAECEDTGGVYCSVCDGISYEQNGVMKHKSEWRDVDSGYCIDDNSDNPLVLPGTESSIMCYDGLAWISTDKGLYYYDGITGDGASGIAYVPVTTSVRNMHRIMYEKDVKGGWTDYGIAYEPRNLIGKKRINTFALTDFISKYVAGNEDYIPSYYHSELTLDAEIESVDRVEILTDVGVFTEIDSTYYSFSGNCLKIIGFIVGTYNSNARRVGWCPAPCIMDGVTENVRVTFVAKDPDLFETKVDKCGTSVMYGIGKDDRLFVTGNKNYPHYVWYSEMANPSYFPDINYAVIGNGDTKVVGFSKVNKNLLVHKEGNEQDTTLFMMSGTFDNEGNAIFTVEQGINGVGAVSRRGFGNFDDMPLFVATNGVYSVDSTNIISEKTVINRSEYVNSRLCAHDLSKASCISYKDMFMIAVDGYVYILYPRKQSYFGADNVSYASSFEGMRWSGIPAQLFCIYLGDLYFGTADGRICRFNTDINDLSRYNDYPTPGKAPDKEEEPEDARAVVAYFTTRLDDDGSFMSLKTMVKRGCGIMIKPYAQSSVKVYALTESEHERLINPDGALIKEGGAAYFSFDPFYFDVIDFSTRDTARIIPFNTKIKKYAALQFKVVNDKLNQGFGVYGIEKRYTVGNYKKY